MTNHSTSRHQTRFARVAFPKIVVAPGSPRRLRPHGLQKHPRKEEESGHSQSGVVPG
jgi:hypothetical protein